MRILDRDYMRPLLEELRFTPGSIEKLGETAEKIRADRELENQFECYYREEIESGNWVNVWEIKEPRSEAVGRAFGREFTLFYLLCYLDYLCVTQEKYKSLGIPREIYVDTLRDIGVWLENWHKMYSFYCLKNHGWIWRHLTADLFRLGRLQYQLTRYSGDFRVYRKHATGCAAVFSVSPLKINQNGDMLGAGGYGDDRLLFESQFREDEASVFGNPITPYGKVDERTVRLSKKEWDCVFQKGDDILEIHIPRDGEFTREACKNSYAQAREFYAKYFPERKPQGLFCHTWLFTPQLQEILSPGSNIVKFQREFYLLPNAGSWEFLWSFVFDETVSLENAPQDTYLRRKAVEYRKQRKPLFDLQGICLHGPEQWGNEQYMTGYDNKNWEKDVHGSV